MQYIIIRNGQDYGPYDAEMLRQYVENGKLLLHDRARLVGADDVNTVGHFLKKERIKVKIASKGSLRAQLRAIGSDLIVPRDSFRLSEWIQDKRLLMLTLVGLGPYIVTVINPTGFLLFYSISLYFAIIWGLFFYYLFKTEQVKRRTTVALFFLSQAFIFIAWDLLNLPKLNPFYLFIPFGDLGALIGFVFGVGLTEEFAKLVPLIVIYRFSKEPLFPKTMVYYGLLSGIAFGVYEGVEYQMGYNMSLEYSDAFLYNIARLTYLPFLHATWAGIAGYFYAFSKLYPLYRRSLMFLALAVPATIHGLYDTFCVGFLGKVIALFIMASGVILLNSYLKRSTHYQAKLRS